MSNFDLGNNSRNDLIFSKDRGQNEDLLEDGSQDLYDIIKFCCAIKENPDSPNFREWSRKVSNSDLVSLVYGFKANETKDFGESAKRILSYAQRAQIYAMTAITAINSGEAEKAVWNAVRGQKYVSQIQEILSDRTVSDGLSNLSEKERSAYLDKAIKKVYPKSFPKPKTTKKKTNGKN